MSARVARGSEVEFSSVFVLLEAPPPENAVTSTCDVRRRLTARRAYEPGGGERNFEKVQDKQRELSFTIS